MKWKINIPILLKKRKLIKILSTLDLQLQFKFSVLINIELRIEMRNYSMKLRINLWMEFKIISASVALLLRI